MASVVLNYRKSVTIKLYYGGVFVHEPRTEYIVGKIDILEDVLLDYLSLLDLHQCYNELHQVPNLNLYYLAPGYELWEGGAILLRNDNDVVEMIDFFD